MYKSIFAAILASSLTACVAPPQTGELPLRPFPDSPDPVVDTTTMTQERLSSFHTNKVACRRIQEEAMPFSFLEAFGSSDVKATERHREEKASRIMRECLSGRGFVVLN